MAKNETELIIRRARVTNNYVRAQKCSSYRSRIVSAGVGVTIVGQGAGLKKERSYRRGRRIPGGNGDAVFKDAAGNFAANAGAARRIQLAGRFTF